MRTRPILTLPLFVVKGLQASDPGNSNIIIPDDKAAQEEILRFVESLTNIRLNPPGNELNSLGSEIEPLENTYTAPIGTRNDFHNLLLLNSNEPIDPYLYDPEARLQRIRHYVQSIEQAVHNINQNEQAIGLDYSSLQDLELQQSASMIWHIQRNMIKYLESASSFNAQILCTIRSSRTVPPGHAFPQRYINLIQEIEQSLVSICLRDYYAILPLCSTGTLFENRIEHIIDYFGLERKNIDINDPEHIVHLISFPSQQLLVMLRSFHFFKTIHEIKDKLHYEDFVNILLDLIENYRQAIQHAEKIMSNLPIRMRTNNFIFGTHTQNVAILIELMKKLKEYMGIYERSLTHSCSSTTSLSEEWLQGTSASLKSSTPSKKQLRAKNKLKIKKSKSKKTSSKKKGAQLLTQQSTLPDLLDFSSSSVTTIQSTITSSDLSLSKSLPASKVENSLSTQETETFESTQSIEDVLQEIDQQIQDLKNQWNLDHKKKLEPKKTIPVIELTDYNTVIASNAEENFNQHLEELTEGLKRILISQPNATLTLRDITRTIHLLGGSVSPHNNGYQISFRGFTEFFEVIHGRGERHTLTRFWIKRIAIAIYVATKLEYIDKIMLKYFPPGWESKIYSGRLLDAIKETNS